MLMEFEGLQDSLMVRTDDAFHLYAANNVPDVLASYINPKGQFLVEDFLNDLLIRIDEIVTDAFEEDSSCTNLEIVTSNKVLKSDLNCEGCQQRLRETNHNRTFEQCPNCAYAVSQTKAGICLQFQWRSSDGELIYCSMDLILAYCIVEIESVELANIINTGFLRTEQPDGTLKYLRNYIECDMVMEDLIKVKSDFQKNKTVFLKLLHSESNLYYIRPGQLLGREKFPTKCHHLLYQQVKFFKKSFNLDINMYMLKKLLWKPEVMLLHFECLNQREFVLRVLSMPELKRHFEGIFDFRAWERRSSVDVRFHPQFP